MPKYLTEAEIQRRACWRKNCEVCGNIFGWSKNGDAAKYCSRTCAGRANGKIPRNFGKIKNYTCAECGIFFSSYYKGRKFCSRPCTFKNWKEDVPLGIRMRKDNNHQEIVDALTNAGAIVFDTSDSGNGFPDLIVGINKRLMLMEIKNTKTAYGRAGPNKNQDRFFAMYDGYPVFMVTDPEDAIKKLRCIA